MATEDDMKKRKAKLLAIGFYLGAVFTMSLIVLLSGVMGLPVAVISFYVIIGLGVGMLPILFMVLKKTVGEPAEKPPISPFDEEPFSFEEESGEEAGFDELVPPLEDEEE